MSVTFGAVLGRISSTDWMAAHEDLLIHWCSMQLLGMQHWAQNKPEGPMDVGDRSQVPVSTLGRKLNTAAEGDSEP